MIVYTIGHSTRPLDELVRLLHAHGVVQIGDVRTIPKSRRHPHFSREALSESLPVAGIVYRHFPGLGGLRKPSADSVNSGWRHPGFRGYADYMQTPAFAAALDELLTWAGEGSTAVMCAEAVWWQCHRQLVADALVARSVEVRHIMSDKAAPVHTLTSFARVDALSVTYPGLI